MEASVLLPGRRRDQTTRLYSHSSGNKTMFQSFVFLVMECLAEIFIFYIIPTYHPKGSYIIGIYYDPTKNRKLFYRCKCPIHPGCSPYVPASQWILYCDLSSAVHSKIGSGCASVLNTISSRGSGSSSGSTASRYEYLRVSARKKLSERKHQPK
jgi:hypothetical protein